jgi:GNAT superfamily N-acetyltransferase
MDEATSASGVVIGPERYRGDGPVRVVEAAEAELIARYGGLADDELRIDPSTFEPPAGTFIVARSGDGVVVGGVGVRPFDGAPSVGEIKRLWVDPSWRRRGLGRVLMDEIAAAAERLGFSELHLATGDNQPEAVALYRSSGWERRERDRSGAVLPDWHLQFSKPLT